MVSAIETLRPGDHAALIYRTRAEQFSTICPFIASGLARKERCLYVANDTSVPLVLSKLSKAGIDTTAAQASGALIVSTKNDTFRKDGAFEPEMMVDDLKEQTVIARKLGFTGFRATGEMTWTLGEPEALDRLIEYECLLHKEFSPFLTGLCQYDETRFSPALLSDIIRIHPKLIANGKMVENPFHSRPEEVLMGSLSHVSVRDLKIIQC